MNISKDKYTKQFEKKKRIVYTSREKDCDTIEKNIVKDIEDECT